MFCFTYIYFDIICLGILADDHTGIDFFAGTDEKCSTFLCTVKAISYRFTGFVCDQGTLFAVLDISFIWSISVECCVHNTISFCICQEITTITNQTTGWNAEFKTGVSAIGSTHCLQFTLSLAQLVDDNTGVFIRYINVSNFHRLKKLTILIFVIQDFGFADCEFVSFTSHILNQNR